MYIEGQIVFLKHYSNRVHIVVATRWRCATTSCCKNQAAQQWPVLQIVALSLFSITSHVLAWPLPLSRPLSICTEIRLAIIIMTVNFNFSFPLFSSNSVLNISKCSDTISLCFCVNMWFWAWVKSVKFFGKMKHCICLDSVVNKRMCAIVVRPDANTARLADPIPVQANSFSDCCGHELTDFGYSMKLTLCVYLLPSR